MNRSAGWIQAIGGMADGSPLPRQNPFIPTAYPPIAPANRSRRIQVHQDF